MIRFQFFFVFFFIVLCNSVFTKGINPVQSDVSIKTPADVAETVDNDNDSVKPVVVTETIDNDSAKRAAVVGIVENDSSKPIVSKTVETNILKSAAVETVEHDILKTAAVLEKFDDDDSTNKVSKPLADAKLKAELLALFEKSDELSIKRNFASWNYDSDLSKKNAIALQSVSVENLNIKKEIHEKLKNVSCDSFDDDLVKYVECRQMNNLGIAGLPTEKYTEFNNLVSDMQKIFATPKLCKYNTKQAPTPETDSATGQCNLDFDPTVINIIGSSRDPAELAHYWKEFRDKTGRLVRHKFARYVKLFNEGVALNKYKDAGEYWLSVYNQPNFKDTVESLWNQVKPLYKELHAYVRRKLLVKYGPEVVFEKEPIPAHLLGNMWAQSWANIHDITLPYPNKVQPDITQELKDQGYTVVKMFKKAEDFFLSLNMSRMTDDFWQNSVMVRPKDRDMVCHGSAWDFHDGKTYRIKMCALVNEDDLTTIHHEMGHIEYDMQYAHQLPFYQYSPNPGFHEAVGDTIVLSVKTNKHLKRIGLLNEDYKDDHESTINELFKFGLERLTFLPFGYLTDLWRYSVFNGSVTEDQYEQSWWKLREEYQGLQPPMDRSEDDFDPGSKYHVSSNVEYLRYFVSYFSQFQFHKALCTEAGQFDPKDPERMPLHECDIYGSKKAGNLFKKMLSLGASKPWPDAMEVITGQKTLDASAILQYFQPLYKWLKEENKKSGTFVGWTKGRHGVYKTDEELVQAMRNKV